MRLATLAELLEHGHGLALYCAGCDRWSAADLRALIAAGHGTRRLATTRFRCRDCGDIAERQVRPPVPVVSRAVPYCGTAR